MVASCKAMRLKQESGPAFRASATSMPLMILARGTNSASLYAAVVWNLPY